MRTFPSSPPFRSCWCSGAADQQHCEEKTLLVGGRSLPAPHTNNGVHEIIVPSTIIISLSSIRHSEPSRRCWCSGAADQQHCEEKTLLVGRRSLPTLHTNNGVHEIIVPSTIVISLSSIRHSEPSRRCWCSGAAHQQHCGGEICCWCADALCPRVTPTTAPKKRSRRKAPRSLG
jgi:hypothetical protein